MRLIFVAPVLARIWGIAMNAPGTPEVIGNEFLLVVSDGSTTTGAITGMFAAVRIGIICGASLELMPITATTFWATASLAHCVALLGSSAELQTMTCSSCVFPLASLSPPALLIALARACTAPGHSGFDVPAEGTSNSPMVATLTGSPVNLAAGALAGAASALPPNPS